MFNAPKLLVDNNYDGNRTFTWLADLSGLSVDLVNFLMCQFAALFLASLFRSVFHPSKVSSEVRHIFALTIGLAFGYFCFGQEAIHIALLPAMCYIVIRTQDPSVVQRTVLIVAMSYLLTVHLIRQIYDYSSYSLDITGPLMIITQKVTSLAFNIHDGFIREKQNLTKGQQYHAIHKLPSALEYFSYVLHFQGLMVGPLIFYKDYIDFVDGKQFLKGSNPNTNLDNRKSKIIIEPSPTKAVIKKVIGSLVCAMIFMKFVKMYPIKHMKDDDFISGTSVLYKLWYAMVATTCIRFKYYHAWLLADAICNNSGLGFTGYDKEGNSKWDLVTNINVLSFEFASNIRDAINNWNIGTNRWLRAIVYERVPKEYGTTLTFALSAVWHGFYAGYYVTFATGALMVTAARFARRMLRHRFQRTQYTRMFYDILTCATTRLSMGYITFPFVLLEFTGSMRVYLKLYICLHIVALSFIFILPKFLRGDNRQTKQSVILTNLSTLKVNSAEDVDKTKTATIPISSAHNSNTIKCNSDDLRINVKYHHEEWTESLMKMSNGNGRTNIETKFINFPSPLMSESNEEKPDNVQQQIPSYDAVSFRHDQCEMDNLSHKIKEKIDIETKNIEDFIDKTVNGTVNGIVDFTNDLMRNSGGKLFIPQDGIRKRTSNSANKSDAVDVFIKKEIDAINAAVHQANVLPAVLSNGHAK